MGRVGQHQVGARDRTGHDALQVAAQRRHEGIGAAEERQVVDGEEGARGATGGRQDEIGGVKDVERARNGLDRDRKTEPVPQAGEPIIGEGNGAQTDPRSRFQVPGPGFQTTGGGKDGILVRVLRPALQRQERRHQLAGVAADASALPGRSGVVDTNAHRRHGTTRARVSTTYSASICPPAGITGRCAIDPSSSTYTASRTSYTPGEASWKTASV